MLSLPSLFNYSEPHPVIPQDTVNYNSSVVPINGATFQPSSQIILDLPRQEAHLIPDSLYIKFTCAVVSTTAAPNMLGTPVYTPFQRVECHCNGTFLESQNGFNFVQNMVNPLHSTTHRKSEHKILMDTQEQKIMREIWTDAHYQRSPEKLFPFQPLYQAS